jgi:uncharacterized repeat protein (TIGR04138 family)
MTFASNSLIQKPGYHPQAFDFVFAALKYTQDHHVDSQDEFSDSESEDEWSLLKADSHVSGPELLDGIREFAIKQFGLMTISVFKHWGVKSTDDFGRIVFELIERGEMRKTDQDQLSDFFDLYDFEEAFNRQFQVDTSSVK